MKTKTCFKDNLSFWIASLFVWQFVANFSPSSTVRSISILLCLIDAIFLLWVVRSKPSIGWFEKPSVKVGTITFLILQFSLSLPIQISDSQLIYEKTYDDPEDFLSTCLKEASKPSMIHLNCQLSDQKLEAILSKDSPSIQIQNEKIGVSYHQVYTYTLLDWMLDLPKTNQPTLFQQSHITLYLSPSLAKQLNI